MLDLITLARSAAATVYAAILITTANRSHRVPTGDTRPDVSMEYGEEATAAYIARAMHAAPNGSTATAFVNAAHTIQRGETVTITIPDDMHPDQSVAIREMLVTLAETLPPTQDRPQRQPLTGEESPRQHYPNMIDIEDLIPVAIIKANAATLGGLDPDRDLVWTLESETPIPAENIRRLQELDEPQQWRDLLAWYETRELKGMKYGDYAVAKAKIGERIAKQYPDATIRRQMDGIRRHVAEIRERNEIIDAIPSRMLQIALPDRPDAIRIETPNKPTTVIAVIPNSVQRAQQWQRLEHEAEAAAAANADQWTIAAPALPDNGADENISAEDALAHVGPIISNLDTADEIIAQDARNPYRARPLIDRDQLLYVQPATSNTRGPISPLAQLAHASGKTTVSATQKEMADRIVSAHAINARPVTTASRKYNPAPETLAAEAAMRQRKDAAYAARRAS